MELEKVLSKLNCMVYMTEAHPTEWKTSYISNSVESLTGWTFQEHLTKKVDWLDLIHAEDKDLVLMESSLLLVQDTEITQEYRITDKFGNIKHVQDIKSSQTVGNIKIILGIVKDVTSYKVAVDKNKRLINELILKNNEMQKIIQSYHILNSLAPKDNDLILENLNYVIENFFEDRETNSLRKLAAADRDTLKSQLLETINSTSRKHSFNELSSRENEVARLLANGKRQKEIAQELSISVETVKTHAKRIRQKLSALK